MHPFQELIEKFNQDFDTTHFPSQPASLYEPSEYFLKIGGKRIRPVLCLLGNELFSDLHPDAFLAAKAVELFHNFSLVHDDMMDEANLRRGQPTVHTKYDANTALLVGDIMVIRAYEYLQPIQSNHLSKILGLFNQTAREVCEGQQLDMDYAKRSTVSLEEYIHMITLKTSVLLAASLQMGAIIGGAGEHNCSHLYEFGKKLGIAFQIQDDYLDAFGDAVVFGKDAGGDIKQNKKTFLLIRALETANPEQLNALNILLTSDPADKV
jgi:geranylgeranyl diphosphate synthase type II